MTLRTPNRTGITLTEVLVALFVMALGMLALLTLFPLGAMQIGQALKDDRTAQSALEADAFMRTYWEHEVVQKWDSTTTGVEPDPFVWAFDDPNMLNRKKHPGPPEMGDYDVQVDTFLNGTTEPYLPSGLVIPPMSATAAMPMKISDTSLLNDLYPTNGSGTYTPSASPPSYYVNAAGNRNKQPSYPVLIDPMGHYMTRSPANSTDKYWVARGSQGASSQLLIPRRKLNTIVSSNAAFQHFAMTDDIWFEANGAPGSAGLRRQGRYNWAIMLQRPDNRDPKTADFKVLVFDGRLPSIAPANEEVMVLASTTAGQRQLTITMPPRNDDEAPLLRIGGWLIDGTVTDAPPINPGTDPSNPTSPRRADHYRITGLTQDETNPNVYYLDLDHTFTYTEPNAQIYFFAGLAEIFVRPPL